VYIHAIPNISVAELNTSFTLDSRGEKLNLKINAKIENKEFDKKDSLMKNDEFLLRISLFHRMYLNDSKTGIEFP
jgi:hypothetical protein